MDLSATVTRSENVAAALNGNGAGERGQLFNAGIDFAVTLNEIGEKVWRLIARPRTIRSLVQDLSRDFDAAPEIIAADLLVFLERLKQAGLVRVQDESDQARSSDTSMAELLAVPWTRHRVDVSLTGQHDRGSRSAPIEESVLLVGLSIDPQMATVAAALERRGAPLVRLDVDRVPATGSLVYAPGAPSVTCRAAFCRYDQSVSVSRPVCEHYSRVALTFEPWNRLPERMHRFASHELRSAVVGWVDSLDAPAWMNGYWEALCAAVKPTQLSVAARNGLAIPPSLVTDRPEAVRQFFEAVGGEVVYKSLDDPVVWQTEDGVGFLYTSALEPDHVRHLDDLLVHPGLFQQRLHPVCEYRVTVVGEQLFATRVPTRTEGVDWRRLLRTGRIEFEGAVLDPAVEQALRRTVTDLGLTFAAVDLMETIDGLYFLELNPTGAFTWLEQLLDLPITDAICDFLLGETPSQARASRTSIAQASDDVGQSSAP